MVVGHLNHQQPYYNENIIIKIKNPSTEGFFYNILIILKYLYKTVGQWKQ